MVNIEIRLITFLQPNMEKLYIVSKNKTRSWLWLRSWTPYCQIQTEIVENRGKTTRWFRYDLNKIPYNYTIQLSHSVMSDFFLTHWLQHARTPCPSPTPGVYSNSCPWSLWYYLTISSSVVPFSSCLQSFAPSRSFQMSQFFTSGGQSIAVSALNQPFHRIFSTDFL